MNRQGIFDLLTNGDNLSADDVTAYKLPAIPTALAALGQITARYVVGPTSKTIVTLTDAPLVQLTGESFGTLCGDESPTVASTTQTQLLNFPVGQNIVRACWASLKFTKHLGTITTGAITYGIGSVIATNATLADTMIDMCPLATTASLSATVGTYTALKADRLAAAATFDGTTTGGATPLYDRVYLNVAAPGTPPNLLLVSGTITLVTTFAGDY